MDDAIKIGPAEDRYLITPDAEVELGLRPREEHVPRMGGDIRLAPAATAIRHDGMDYAPDGLHRLVPVDFERYLSLEAVEPVGWDKLEPIEIELQQLKGLDATLLGSLAQNGIRTVAALADCDVCDLIGWREPDGSKTVGFL